MLRILHVFVFVRIRAGLTEGRVPASGPDADQDGRGRHLSSFRTKKALPMQLWSRKPQTRYANEHGQRQMTTSFVQSSRTSSTWVTSLLLVNLAES